MSETKQPEPDLKALVKNKHDLFELNISKDIKKKVADAIFEYNFQLDRFFHSPIYSEFIRALEKQSKLILKNRQNSQKHNKTWIYLEKISEFIKRIDSDKGAVSHSLLSVKLLEKYRNEIKKKHAFTLFSLNKILPICITTQNENVYTTNAMNLRLNETDKSYFDVLSLTHSDNIIHQTTIRNLTYEMIRNGDVEIMLNIADDTLLNTEHIQTIKTMPKIKLWLYGAIISIFYDVYYDVYFQRS